MRFASALPTEQEQKAEKAAKNAVHIRYDASLVAASSFPLSLRVSYRKHAQIFAPFQGGAKDKQFNNENNNNLRTAIMNA